MDVQVSDSELNLLKIIWANGGTAFYAHIMAELSKAGCAWQKNTVITLLSRLADKEMVKIRKIGRKNEYIAVVSEQDYQKAQARTLLNKLYDGSAKGLVSTLIQGDMISVEEYEELKQFWEKEEGSG
ncbi:MAG: BlaI/MecI/CopY family transcriptional regulator [Eubacterium sp.]|nr:BlaI/MecI/CopY family transcriptional regulator [Eubacterium sp.]MCI8919424.1 BlaI/MecI/CopY family transcriptional regulator [Eubacterium sp.]